MGAELCCVGLMDGTLSAGLVAREAGEGRPVVKEDRPGSDMAVECAGGTGGETDACGGDKGGGDEGAADGGGNEGEADGGGEIEGEGRGSSDGATGGGESVGTECSEGCGEGCGTGCGTGFSTGCGEGCGKGSSEACGDSSGASCGDAIETLALTRLRPAVNGGCATG